MTIAEALMTALTSYDEKYVEAEKLLLPVAAQAARLLEADRSADPAASVFGRVLREAGAGSAEAFATIDPFLDSLAAEVRDTPVMQPVPQTVARILDHRYGGAAVAFAAWRLIRQPGMPEWRAMSLLMYCARHPQSTPAAALARFAAAAANERLLRYAVDVLRTVDGGFEALVAEARWRAGV